MPARALRIAIGEQPGLEHLVGRESDAGNDIGLHFVVPNYNVMGPVKAALEATCRYLAYELGPKRIRVHAISPGPLQTRAASGLKDFNLLLNDAIERAPVGEPVDIMDVGFTCAFLATPYARRVTGSTVYVDGGMNIIA